MRLCFGPMSQEAIEAIFQSSHYLRIPIDIVASLNQVNKDGGYVYSTQDLMLECERLDGLYKFANVRVGMDHFWIGRSDKEEIKVAIENGYKHIHLDPKYNRDVYNFGKTEISRLIEFIRDLSGDVTIELGDETTEESPHFIDTIYNEYKPDYIVTGLNTKVMEGMQCGEVDYDKLRAIQHLPVKIHGADFLDVHTIRNISIINPRFGLNVAPQLAVVQSRLLMMMCDTYGINYFRLYEMVCESASWRRWIYPENENNYDLIFACMAHYFQQTQAYVDAYSQIHQRASNDMNYMIVNQLREVITHYDKSTKGTNE
jgi:hypothetical protein